MNPEIAKAIYMFLMRVELKGEEAPAFVQCLSALQQVGKPKEPEKDAVPE